MGRGSSFGPRLTSPRMEQFQKAMAGRLYAMVRSNATLGQIARVAVPGGAPAAPGASAPLATPPTVAVPARDAKWKCARAERSALVALFHHAVIPVPVRVNVFLFARTLQPDRGQIAETNKLARFQFFERKFQEGLRWVEGVSAARASVDPIHA